MLLHFIGRKFSTTEVRNRMLRSQRPYLRLQTDEYFETLDETVLSAECERIGELDADSKKLRDFNRQRIIACWHDTSKISNASHLLITFCTLYDKAIFYTQNEYFEKEGKPYLSSVLTKIFF